MTALVGVGACSDPKDKAPAPTAPVPAPAPLAAAAPAEAEINPRLLRRFQPIADTQASTNPSTVAKVDLGRRLFYDVRLSKDADLSCNSCHDLPSYGVDHQKTSRGHKNQTGERNAPTVYNAAGFFAQFWDGRAPTVEEQAKGPILNPAEMAMTDAKQVVAFLKSVPEYQAAFREAFPDVADSVTFDNTSKAIGAFERGLLTPGRWDTFLRGDKSALTAAEREGLKTFLNVGCMVCHTGPYLGGSMFERVGAVEPWPNQNDRGRAKVTGAEEDAMMFKVPTLRNIAKTAPYFHDGSVESLPDAVRMMGKHQLGLELSDAEVSSIVAWLESLTGELPSAYIAKPVPYGAKGGAQ